MNQHNQTPYPANQQLTSSQPNTLPPFPPHQTVSPRPYTPPVLHSPITPYGYSTHSGYTSPQSCYPSSIPPALTPNQNYSPQNFPGFFKKNEN